MKKEELSIHYGTQIWKSHLEYFNDSMFLHGFPYYRISEVEEVYYLWKLREDDPDSGEYTILKQSNEFDALYQEGMELENNLRKKLYPERNHFRLL